MESTGKSLDTWGKVKRFNVYVIIVPEGEKREQGIKNMDRP